MFIPCGLDRDEQVWYRCRKGIGGRDVRGPLGESFCGVVFGDRLPTGSTVVPSFVRRQSRAGRGNGFGRGVGVTVDETCLTVVGEVVETRCLEQDRLFPLRRRPGRTKSSEHYDVLSVYRTCPCALRERRDGFHCRFFLMSLWEERGNLNVFSLLGVL